MIRADENIIFSNLKASIDDGDVAELHAKEHLPAVGHLSADMVWKFRIIFDYDSQQRIAEKQVPKTTKDC